MDRKIKTGDVLKLDGRAGILYKIRPIHVRVIKTLEPTVSYDGEWIDAYELDDDGNAVERRDLFVQPSGVELVDPQSMRPKPIARRTARVKSA